MDRRGGEICCVTADGRRRVFEVEGDEEYPIRKTKASDWNQSRFQRAAEMVWKANARKVGREVDVAARQCGAEAVVVAGDVQARGALLEEISEGLRDRTVETDRGSRADGADGAGLDAEVARILQIKRSERIGAVAERFERELANGQRAVAGLPATVRALRLGQVESLLLEDDPDSPARLWVGPEPGDVAMTAGELRDAGVADPVQERADAALIRAAACADGELFIVPPDDPYAGLGVGAVLRYTIAA
ncbi:baeRF2 domain-containing protein [Actinomadura keratinilytica]|uniref:baeRF2 domain-containing protein n=1 Tax=Actinomadura keratinilytica TaxID=547461 RepID=UPI0036116D43